MTTVRPRLEGVKVAGGLGVVAVITDTFVFV